MRWGEPGYLAPPSPQEMHMLKDPDLTFITIDRHELLRNRNEVEGVEDPETDVKAINIADEYYNYPEACSVDKYGNILVSIRDEEVQRRIDGVALDKLKDKPMEPRKPYIVGVETDKVTIGWESTDLGTGLVDQYHVEYKEVSKHDSDFKVLVVREWVS